MTKSETIEILEVLRRAFPKFLDVNDTRELKATANVWHEFLGPYPKELCLYAVHRYIQGNKFAPAISEILAIVTDALEPERDEAADAWNALQKAASRASAVTAAEFEALPYEVKRFCGSLSGLLELGMINSDTFNTVTRGQFLKVYDSMRRSRETLNAMPEGIKALVGSLAKPIAEPPKKRLPAPKHEVVVPTLPEPAQYETPSEEEWERMRQAQLAKLGG
jgi:hypothetical protein